MKTLRMATLAIVILAVLGFAMAPPSCFAGEIYVFSGNITPYFFLPNGAAQSFTYVAQNFITQDTFVAAMALSKCSTGYSATCGGIDFLPSSPGFGVPGQVVQIAFRDGVVNPNYYFPLGAFTKDGTYSTVNFQGANTGTLTVTHTAAQITVIHVPADVPDIQSAINQAAAIVGGGTPSDILIEVAPGTYSPAGNPGYIVDGINNPFFTVTLRAAQSAMVTILDASNIANNVFSGFGTRNLVIDGFTIRNRIPDQTNFLGRGMRFVDSSGVTVQNCNFDTTDGGMRFQFADPTLGGRIQVIHNTGVSGQGTDPNAASTIIGANASLVTAYPPGANPTGEPKFIVEHNVFRANISDVRFINTNFDVNGNILGAFSNGSLEMTGNDLSSSFAGGFNVIGGHGHLIGANRIHDGDTGGFFQSAFGTIANNVIFNNVEHGLFVANAGPGSQDFSAEGISILHNTIVKNGGTGIVYVDEVGGVHSFLPTVYNNVIAFNDAGGAAAVEASATVFAFIPVSFNLAGNDNYGNTLRNLGVNFFEFSYVGISNPGAAAPNYSGVLNTGLDLSVVPGFDAPQEQDFSLMPNSMLVNAGITSRPTPFQDFAGNLRDAHPDVGAYEFVPTPVLNVRSNPSATRRRPNVQ